MSYCDCKFSNEALSRVRVACLQGIEISVRTFRRCIKWVQEAFPPGGNCSGLVVIYEQCVHTFWHADRYKGDFRYLKVWLEYEANNIGVTHTPFYISYALLMEQKNKNKTANEIFNSGLSMKTEQVEKLTAAYQKFLSRSMRQLKATEEDVIENHVQLETLELY